VNRALHAFRDAHLGETIVVCGCGPSLKELPDPERMITLGVNDVGRLFDPTYLVVVNPRSQFKYSQVCPPYGHRPIIPSTISRNFDTYAPPHNSR